VKILNPSFVLFKLTFKVAPQTKSSLSSLLALQSPQWWFFSLTCSGAAVGVAAVGALSSVGSKTRVLSSSVRRTTLPLWSFSKDTIHSKIAPYRSTSQLAQ
jgi:hypothetical protein